MIRLSYRTFSRGWWPMGDITAMPPNTLRRAVGTHAIKTGTLRSRWGSTELFAIAAHSLYRFAGSRFQGSGISLLRDGVPIASNLSGNRLRFVRMPPQPGDVDYLFVAGGGKLFKVAPDGGVSKWGIDAPPQDPTLAVSAETPPADGMTATPGAAGALTGSFSYIVTFREAATQLETTHNPTPVVATPTAQVVDLAAIPTGAGAVDQRRIYRTKDGGTDFFLLTTINDNSTLVFSDNVTDNALAPAGTLPAAFLDGVFKYAATFRNSVTGTRSNPNPAVFSAAGPQSITANKQPITLSNLPISNDPQVDVREIWRTSPNLDVLFKLAEVQDNTTTIFEDNLPDAAFDAFGPEQLPIDNARPEDTFQDAVGPYQGRMWWDRDLSAGDAGRVFFSPIGRPESLGGFVEVNNGDDPTQRLVFWGGVLYCFTAGKIIQIIGTDEPFTFNEVFGAPGTNEPFSVVATPFGILYQAVDGIRLFDGAASRLIGFAALALLFQGEALEGVPPFTAIISEYAGREVWFSDETTTLVVDPGDGTWRIAKSGVTALYYEPDTELLTGSYDTHVVVMEPPNVTLDVEDPIPFEVETPGRLSDIASPMFVERVYLEVDTNDQLVTPTLVLDSGEVALPAFRTVGRPIEPPEIAIGRWTRVAAIRLDATLVRQVTVYGIDLDVYAPVVAAPTPDQTVESPA